MTSGDLNNEMSFKNDRNIFEYTHWEQSTACIRVFTSLLFFSLVRRGCHFDHTPTDQGECGWVPSRARVNTECWTTPQMASVCACRLISDHYDSDSSVVSSGWENSVVHTYQLFGCGHTNRPRLWTPGTQRCASGILLQGYCDISSLWLLLSDD